MTEIVRITVNAIYIPTPTNTMENVLWYLPFPEPAIPLTVADVSALLDEFATTVWEADILPIVSDTYRLSTLVGDVLDTTLPAPHLTPVTTTQTTFVQTDGQRVGAVANRTSVISIKKERTTRITRSGGVRLGPVLRGDWINNQPADGVYLNLINQASATLGGTLSPLAIDFFPAIWGGVTDTRLVPVINGINGFVFTRLTTQRSRLD